VEQDWLVVQAAPLPILHPTTEFGPQQPAGGGDPLEMLQQLGVLPRASAQRSAQVIERKKIEGH
jgi:hypothetical protein